jgi:hypothetical protein
MYFLEMVYIAQDLVDDGCHCVESASSKAQTGAVAASFYCTQCRNSLTREILDQTTTLRDKWTLEAEKCARELKMTLVPLCVVGCA